MYHRHLPRGLKRNRRAIRVSSNVVRLKTFGRIGKRNYRSILFVIIIGIMFSVRVLFTSMVATEGGLIRTYENEITLLREEIASTNIKIAQMSSLANIEKRASQELQMVLSKNGVVYLQGYQDAVKIAKY